MRSSSPLLSGSIHDVTSRGKSSRLEEGGPVCRAEMKDGRTCGRPVYKDKVCLMHSCDTTKDNQEFQKEFDRILKDAGDKEADFWGFVFPCAEYSGREFAANCLFVNVTFMGIADFSCTKFKKDANFAFAKFEWHATFESATFEQGAYFSLATFPRVADFRQAIFREVAEFRETVFRGDRTIGNGENDDRLLGPVFWKARFEKPKSVMFYWTYVGQALLNGCDPSELLFSQVIWRLRRGGRAMIFEEVVNLNPEDEFERRVSKEALKSLKAEPNSGNERNYRSIAELYQQLKKNFENHGDESTASDFYFGQMEMKRLSSSVHARFARWLVRNLGLAAIYKNVSEYGESYWRPLIWVLVTVVIFTFAYPLIGLRHSTQKGTDTVTESRQAKSGSTASPVLTYRHASGSGEDETTKWHFRVALVGHSFMTSFGVAFFQRNIADFEPVYPWGRLLESLELLMTYGLLAVFLQVLGRKFKR